MDCLNAMQAAGVSKEECETFINAVFKAIFLEIGKWVTMAHEVPLRPPQARRRPSSKA
jgi:hypothetical protein